MQLKKGEIYFYQGKNGIGFIKIIDISDYITFIISDREYKYIENIDINNYSFNEYYKNGSYICSDNCLNIDNELNIMFKTYDEEISYKFNGNIKIWSKSHNLIIKEVMSGKYKLKYVSFKHINDDDILFIHNSYFIKYEVNINNNFIYFNNKEIKSIKRDQLIDELCN